MEEFDACKKLKINCKSNISFWNDTNNDKFEKEIHIASSDFSFTSAEIMNFEENAKIPNIKFIIREIVESCNSKILYGDDVICTVLGEWKDIKYEVNTKVTIISCLCCNKEMKKEIQNGFIHINVDDTSNFLYIEDDLMTITNLISSIKCINRHFTNTKIADLNFSFADKCLVKGIIIHSVMEQCILANNYDYSFIAKALDSAINNNIMLLYCSDTTEKIIRDELKPSICNIMSFSKHKLVFEECEKRIASLTLNLKGNVDAVGSNSVLEIKSGRSMDISHKAQSIIYSLILKEKYKKNYDPLLFYVATQTFMKLDIKHDEVKSLMILRNKLATHNEIVECNCCEFEVCKIARKINNLSRNHWLKKMWIAIEAEEKYRFKETWHSVKFKKQIDLLVVFLYDHYNITIDDIYVNIYTEDLVKLCKGIVTKHETMFLHISLSEKISLEKNVNYYISFGCNDIFFKYMRYSLINIAFFRYLNRKKSNGFLLPNEEDGLVQEEEFVEISSDLIEFTEICESDTSDFNKNKVDGSIDSSFQSFGSDCDDLIPLSNNTNESTKQTYEATDKGSTIILGDKREILDGSTKLPENNINLRDLIKDKNAMLDILNKNKGPDSDVESSFFYSTPPIPEDPKYAYSIPDMYMSQFMRLNIAQKNALFMALNCENYKIIHGMPGTGKSSVIVLLIRILIYLKKKVLLVCYTNLAIDNILSKLRTLRAYRAKKEKHEYKSTAEIKVLFKNIDLVASTCFGFTDPVFLERNFDYCIIDEGSQQHLLLTLIPITLCHKFIIFGDHLQLKPLSKTSSELSLSLFEYLLNNDQIELNIQYRMGPNIMRLSNELFYSKKLQLGKHREDSVTFIDSSTITYSKYMENVKNSVILCYFNSQVNNTKKLTKCQVETIDRFQGSESDNIIIVFDPVVKCSVLESKERLNVALTRARKSLTLIGDVSKMQSIDIFRKLLQLVNVI